MQIRRYTPADYEQLKQLYLDSSTFGGQFDEARDAADRLQKKVEADPDAILVAEEDGTLLGTLSIVDDGRVAWLFRFAVLSNHFEAVQALHDQALKLLQERGHTQVLVYAPVDDQDLSQRYEQLGFIKGGDYTCYWKTLTV